MHELGIVMHVAKTLDDFCEENDLAEIDGVVLEVGEVSGIMTEYFIDCWNYFRGKHPRLAHAEMKIETLPAVTYCEDCQRTYPTVQYGIECPYCRGRNTYLLKGNECQIKAVEIKDEEDCGSGES